MKPIIHSGTDTAVLEALRHPKSSFFASCKADLLEGCTSKQICKGWGFRYISTMAPMPPVVLTVAGFDPSGGAGITADIKAIAAHGCYGVACITALTVQSTAGVRRVEAVDAGLVAETLAELISDIEVSAVHVGMLGSGSVARRVVEFLAANKLPNVVLDPILKSSSGAELLDAAGVQFLIEELPSPGCGLDSEY